MKTKIVSYRIWIKQFEITEPNKHKKLYSSNPKVKVPKLTRYFHLKPIDVNNPLNVFKQPLYILSKPEIQQEYNNYVIYTQNIIDIENKFTLFERGYQVTPNTWQEVDSLGVTCHHETPGIDYLFVTAKSSTSARYMGAEHFGKSYIEMRARLNNYGNLYKLSNPEKYFTVLDKLEPKHTDALIQLFSCNKNCEPDVNLLARQPQASFYRDNEIYWKLEKEGLILLDKYSPNGYTWWEVYKLTNLGEIIIKSLLPTKHRKILFDQIMEFHIKVNQTINQNNQK